MKMTFFHVLLKLREHYRAAFLLVLCACGMSMPAHASLTRPCPVYPSVANGMVTVPATISVSPRLNVGDTIATYTQSITYPGNGSTIFCAGAAYQPLTQTLSLVRFNTPTSIANVYATNVAGVGIMMTSGSAATPLNPYTRTSNFLGGFTVPAVTEDLTVTFVKTAATVGSGTVTSGAIFQRKWDNAIKGNWGLANNTVITPLVPTCSVSTSSVTINLGNVAASSFATVGSNSTTSGTQNVTLSCQNSPIVTMALQGTRASAAAPAYVVALTPGTGVAQGVGVEVLYNNNPLTLGSGVTVSSSAGSTLTIPVAARYYRTGDITAGRANAAPTLQFTYN
jgi:type 1 fimbria pilin